MAPPSRFRAHFGLARPQKLNRAVVGLAALVLLAVVGLAAAWLCWSDRLTSGTPRFWYVAYLVGLLVAALAILPRPRAAMALVMLAAIEASIGLGSLALHRVGLASTDALAPINVRPLQFAWHPLLQVKPLPNGEGKPYRIGADGWRGKAWSAPELNGKIAIALFGGSTTLDGEQADGEAWPDRLQQTLGSRYAVLNRGVDGYSTAEHVMQTAFYEETDGVPPVCSVYFVGWNDLRNAHLEGVDPGYADFHLPNQIDGFRARYTDIDHSFSPLATMLGRTAGWLFDTLRPATPRGRTSAEPDPALERIFARNVVAISAINRSRAIRTIWIGQLMNRAALVGEQTSAWIPLVPEKAVYPLIQRLNGILEQEAVRLDDVYIGLSPFPPDAFRDHGHFTPAGAARFAGLIAPMIEQYCRR